MIRQKIDHVAAVATDYLADTGIILSPKKVKLMALVYFALIFCFGIHVEMKRLDSYPILAMPQSQTSKQAYFSEELILEDGVTKADPTKRYKILTLGGSNTWGNKLDDRDDAFPYVLNYLKKHTITNRAIPASGSFYPSICIESLLKNDETDYDIIIMEFSTSGFQNFDILIKRLQYRYPNAVFIYIHLYSLRAATNTEEGGRIIWSNKDLTLPGVAVQILFDEIGGYVYSLPSPDDPNSINHLFTSEMTHLSEAGHLKVGEDIARILENVYLAPKQPHDFESFDNQWGYGDECKNWFLTNKNPYEYNGGKMTKISYRDPTDAPDRPTTSRSVLEFKSNHPSSITITNHLDTTDPVPVFFSYIVPANESVKIAVSIFGKTVVLESVASPHTVVEMQEVGVAKKGRNKVGIELLDNTQNFQLVGVAFYGFRFHRGLPMKRMHNTVIIDDASKLQV